MVSARLASLIHRVIDEIWNAGDLDLADELFGAAYVNHGGLIPDLVPGPEGVKFSVALYRTAFPDLQLCADDLRPSGEWSACAGRFEVRLPAAPAEMPARRGLAP